MTLVTLADACTRLPELIGMVAAGEQIVIVQNGVTLAALTPPPFTIPTPEEEAARQAKILDSFREMARWCAEDGIPLTIDHPLRQFLEPESPAA